MRTRILLSIGALAMTVLACSLGGGSGDEIPDITQAIDPSAEPVRVSVLVDDSRAVSSDIPVQGGSLTATGADGATFTLVIPSGALLQATTVTMTPITSMDGLPTSGGLAAAVELKPDGLNFYDFVTLTIDLPQAIPLEEQVPIGVSGAEHNLEIAFADVQNGSFRLQLLHFSSAGVAKGLLADLEPVRQRLGGDVETRLRSVAAREVAYHAQRGDPFIVTPKFIDWYVRTFREYVLNPRIAAAGESCAAGRLALLTYVELQRDLQLLGAPQAVEGFTQEILNLLPTIAQRCITEEYELCRDDHIIHRILPAILELEREIEILGLKGTSIDQVMAQAQDLAAKCLRFELVFQSEATNHIFNEVGVSEVSSTILLAYEPGAMQITGEAPLENIAFDFEDSTSLPGCTFTGAPGPDGTFRVFALRLKVVHDGPEDLLGHVVDIRLQYDPGESHEVLKGDCPGAGSTTPEDIGAWIAVFSLAHGNEIPVGELGEEEPNDPLSGFGSGLYLAEHWTIEGDELFAELSWDKPTGLGTESGSFELYHRPG